MAAVMTETSPSSGSLVSSGNFAFVDGRCSCCPYGYHVDVDFLRFLEGDSRLQSTSGTQRIETITDATSSTDALRRSLDWYVEQQHQEEWNVMQQRNQQQQIAQQKEVEWNMVLQRNQQQVAQQQQLEWEVMQQRKQQLAQKQQQQIEWSVVQQRNQQQELAQKQQQQIEWSVVQQRNQQQQLAQQQQEQIEWSVVQQRNQQQHAAQQQQVDWNLVQQRSENEEQQTSQQQLLQASQRRPVQQEYSVTVTTSSEVDGGVRRDYNERSAGGSWTENSSEGMAVSRRLERQRSSGATEVNRKLSCVDIVLQQDGVGERQVSGRLMIDGPSRTSTGAVSFVSSATVEENDGEVRVDVTHSDESTEVSPTKKKKVPTATLR